MGLAVVDGFVETAVLVVAVQFLAGVVEVGFANFGAVGGAVGGAGREGGGR